MAGKTFAAKTRRKSTKTQGPGVKSKDKSSTRSLDPKSAHAKAGAAPAFSGVQTKVKIGKAGDRYEKEADAVAESVVANRPAPAVNRVGGGPVSRMEKGDEEAKRAPEKEDEKAQRAPEKEDEKAQRAPEKEEEQAQRATEKEEEQAQRAPEKEEEQAQRAPEKEEEQAQRAPEKEEEQAQRAPEQEEDQAQRAPEQDEEHAQRAPEQEEEQAQRAPEQEEEQAQRAPEQEEEQAQRAPEQEEESAQREKKEDESVQKKDVAAQAGGSAAMRAAATHAISYRGSGQALAPTVRARLESSLGQSLRDVRVHIGAEAEKANRVLHAKAFTHGKDIWLGHGQSPNDLRLMAHEVTHVVQQTGKIRRDPAAPAAAPIVKKDEFEDPSVGKIVKNGASYDITLAKLTVQSFKKDKQGNAPFTILAKVSKSKQETKWKGMVPDGDLDAAIEAHRKNLGMIETRDPDGTQRYFFKLKQQGEYRVMGKSTEIRNQCKVPAWSRTGRSTLYAIDHIHEQKLNGPDDETNYWLLERAINRDSGNTIKSGTKNALNDLITKATPAMNSVPSIDDALKKDIKVTALEGVGMATVAEDNHYLSSEVKAHKELDGLIGMSAAEITDASLDREDQLRIFSDASGGQEFVLAWPGGKNSISCDISIGNVKFTTIEYDPERKDVGAGTLKGSVTADTGGKLFPADALPVEVTLFKMPPKKYRAYMEGSAFQKKVSDLLGSKKAKGFSPIEITDVRLVPFKGLYVAGFIEVTVPVLKGTTIDFYLDAGQVVLSKTFYGSDFQFPGPVKVTSGSITAAVGTNGISASGSLEYTVEKLGKGSLKGNANASGLDIEGTFTPDSDSLEATGKVWYRDKKLGGALDMSVKEGKVKGIKSAQLKVTVEEGIWSGTGEVVPEIKAIKKGTLTAKYEEGKGLEIGAKIDFSGAHPAITSGTVEGQVKQGDSGWSFKAAGELQFAVATLTGTIKADYEDGAFTATADLDYKKKLVDGKVKVGVTNRAVDAATGVPSGPGTDAFTVWGSGTVGIQFTPWLKGTVGLKLDPDGKITVSGEVALPSSFEVFPEKKINKNIFTIGLDIPIVGVAVAGQRIGVFATINGGLDAEAGFGPGKLVDTKIGVTYSPDNEDATKITGSAKFQVPAFAGLRLFVNGGLGVGIPIISATAGLEIGGKLGLQGVAEAAANIEWTPSTGIELKAVGSVMIQPSFLFDISAFCKVEADLLLTTIELYNKRWNLASVSYGSGLDFGLTFPIHYKQGEDFNPSFDQVKLTYPNIEAGALLKGLSSQIFSS